MTQGTDRGGPATARASASPRLRSVAAHDEAQIQVLEAVLIGVIMLGAIGFVLTFTLPTSETEPTRQGLDMRATDALSVLSEYPVDDTRYGGNMLSYAVAKALEGDPTVLADRLKALLPPAAKFNVYLSNGQESYTVYESGTPRGETVTATHVLEPKWQYSFVDRDTEFASAPNTLGVYALPVFNSNLIDDGGVLIEVSVDFEQAGHRWTKQSFYSTVQGATDANGELVSSNIYGSTFDGIPVPYYDRTTPGGEYDPSLTTVYVTVEEDEPNGVIPAGTNVVLRIPQGISASIASVPGEYSVVGATTVDPNTGGILNVTLERNVVQGNELTIEFEAPDTGERDYQYFVIDASLAGKVHGKAEILLQDRVRPTFTGGDYIDVYASIPKPMGTTEPSDWTIVVADAPMQPDTIAPVKVRKVTVKQPDGIALFASVETTTAPFGDFQIADGGATLVWEPTGNQQPYEFSGTKRYKAFPLIFKPTPAGVTTRDESRDYLAVPVTVGEDATKYTQYLTRRVEPGLFYGQIPPRAGLRDGYEDLLGSYYPVVAEPVHRGQSLRGNWTYNVSSVPFKDFLSTATIDVEPREAPVGQRATIEINVENLLSRLMLRGFSVTTTTKVFPPWSITTHEPLIKEISEETTAANKDVTQVVLRDITGDDVLDLIVGTNEGKLVGFDVGNDGAVISGLTKTWSGQAVRSLSTMTVDNEAYFVVGLAKDASQNTGTQKTLRVLDDAFEDRPTGYAFDLGAYDVTSVSAGLDLDADGNEDYVAGDDRGTTAAFDGQKLVVDDQTQTPISAGWPHEANARSAITRLGTTGPGPDPTAIVTNGLEASVGIWRTADYSQSTNANDPTAEIFDLAKRVSISTNSDGLFGYTAAGEAVWAFPAGGYLDVDAQDLNADSTTDIVAGTWDGYVYAVNGRQAAMPWQGMTILSGDQITDADFVDADSGWTVDPAGFAMRTTDGMTTRDYANGIPASTQGAYGLDLVDRDLGFIVGAGSTVWKTTDGGLAVDPHSYVIKDPAPAPPFPLPALPDLYPGGTWGTSTYLDVDFYDADKGIIVGGPCGAYCAGVPRPLYTSDGGATWRPGTIELTNASLSIERVTWASSTTAYAVGTPAKVYKTVDSGATWTAVAPPSVSLDAWHGVDCLDASTCWVVGDSGKMWKTTDGGTSWSKVPTGVTANLRDVDFLDADHGIAVGDETTVLLTRDGGANWVLTPGGGPLVADWTTATYVAPDIAYFFGGNANTRAMGTTASYESSAFATTKTITDRSSGLHRSAAAIDSAKIETMAHNNEFTHIDYYLSTDDGDEWTQMLPKDPEDLDLLGSSEYVMQPVWGNSSKLKMRFDMGVDLENIFNTPILRSITITFNANFTCTAADVATCDEQEGVDACDVVTKRCHEVFSIPVLISDGTIIDMDPAKTTAEYVVIGADGDYELRLPRVPKFWTAYLEGAVNDVDASRDVNGDGIKDVVAAVGAVNTALGTPSVVRTDKVFLLDGASGRTLGSYHTVPYGDTAEPWRVRFADIGLTGAAGSRLQDGDPEIIVAISDSTSTTVDGQIVVLSDAMAVIDRWSIVGRPDVLLVDDVDRSDGSTMDDFVVGTAMNSAGLPGTVRIFSAVDELGAGDWTIRTDVSPEIGGRYVVNWDVERDAPYGPYVVETQIAWTDTDTGVEQALYLANYFTVTPPRSKLPVSPIYTVHLVAWFEDWDVER